MSTHVELERATADRDALAVALREVLAEAAAPACWISAAQMARWRHVLDVHGGWITETDPPREALVDIDTYCRDALQREANRRA